MALRPSLLSRLGHLSINSSLLSQMKASTSTASTLRSAQNSLTKRSITTSPFQRSGTKNQFQVPSRPFARSPFSKQNANPARRFNSTKNNGSSNSNKTGGNAEKEDGSISQRLRKLSREYGWAALGVYLVLSAADFPICFAAVRLLGPERIGHYEHVVVQYMKETFKSVWPVKVNEDGEVEESLPRNLEEASIWTQLALAYAIHKSVFIFVRVPLTAAVTPKVVKVLRGWGWNIGKRTPKSP
ncbi:hypothetical protein N7478_006739 [Penicillium angulare]|uniref:uncharacterized protein n=1 Tax=Penicillium angulare TaxID=116970 RepID=UPI00253FC7F9|nr:uncharacterized protein N7478_006739 [Penicillium angulare]KAJ5281367.1 hypothetical protein N7478_006739 [Penicillium angulare]